MAKSKKKNSKKTPKKQISKKKATVQAKIPTQKSSKLSSLKSFLLGRSDKKQQDSKKDALPKEKKKKKEKSSKETLEKKTLKSAKVQPEPPVHILPKVSSKKVRKTENTIQAQAALGGDSICREVACEGLATSGGYCRMHYIKNWKRIKRKELIIKEGKLNRYIEELVAKYPEKYIEAIRQDLASDKDFSKVIHDLELDEGGVDDLDMDMEMVDSLINNLRRDVDDGDETF